MDGLSAASGIVGIIGFTFQLVNVVVQYGMDWKTAPSDVKSFMTELQALKIVISETHANILANPEFEAAFEGRTSAVLSRLGSNAPSVTETKSLLETCHGELQDFVAYLCKKGGGRRFGWWRFTWFFRTRRVRNTVTKLHRICQTFNSMVSIDAATLGATTYREVTAARLEQTEWYRTKNNQGILAWLSHLSFEEEQRENFSKCHTGTGEWFLSSKEFLEWRDSDEFKNSTLCCYGKPGSGKSIITSTVIENLKLTFDVQTVAVAYVYCDYDNPETQRTLNLVSSLVKQLVLQSDDVPAEVEKLYNKHNKGQVSPSLDEYLELFPALSACFEKTFIIVDGLDELLNVGGKGNVLRGDLLTRMQGLKEQSKSRKGCRLFLTSRNREELPSRDHLKDCCFIEIYAAKSDIELYLQSELIENPVFPFFEDLRKDPNLGQAIKVKLVESANGMFLLPHLHVEQLFRQTSIRELREALEHLPTELDDMYDATIARIHAQAKEHSKLALFTLSWVSKTLRPFRLDELQHALAVKPGDRNFHWDGVVAERLLISVCAGLLTLDVQSRIIRLVHFTAEEYLKKKPGSLEPDMGRVITETCLAYLSFEDFAVGYCQSDKEMEDRMRNYPLLDYAARSWGIHARRCPDEVPDEKILHFLRQEKNFESSVQAMRIPKSRESGYSQEFPKQVSALHVAASFGLKGVTGRLLDDGANSAAKDSFGEIALHWAARSGHDDLAELLLDRDKDINAEDDMGRTPLYAAISSRCEEVVDLLLNKGANFKTTTKDGWTPLHQAAWSTNEKVTQLLLKRGPELEAKNKDGRTPLYLAVFRGAEQVVKLLLKEKASTNVIDTKHKPLLFWAISLNNKTIVELLVRNGADVNAEDSLKYSVLHWAASMTYCDDEIIELLLNKIENKDSKESTGQTALHSAAWLNREGLVKLLIRHQANLEAEDQEKKTPLHLAALCGHVGVIRLLLDGGANPNATDKFAWKPLHWALSRGHKNAVETLLNGVADIQDIDLDKVFRFKNADQAGFEEAKRLILERQRQYQAESG